ncbi:MAG: putative oxidoreductase C-terminal domain-containing protein [Gemmataceae bacterium]
MADIRFITLDPGHFHAALVQKEMYAAVAPQVHVYAPLGADLIAHLQRLAGFNSRPTQPTAWQLEVHAAPDFLERLLREKPGNVVILSGRNACKIDYLQAAVGAGLHVLADKPWIIEAADLPRLQDVLDRADAQGLIAYDIMTERYEITNMLQRELVNDAEVFGAPVAGDDQNPGVRMDSVHFLCKAVAGAPLRRPAWFFDIRQQGEGLSDVGTHLVDLTAWCLFPDQALDYRQDIRILSARRWPTKMTSADFQRVTGESVFPDFLAEHVHDGQLDYFCNTFIAYTLRGIQVQMNVLWDYESAGGGDTHMASFRGSRARVEIHQGAEQNYRPELYVVANEEKDRNSLAAALRRRVVAWQQEVYPGVDVVEEQARWWITIPDRYRVGHEAHFAEVTRRFLAYLHQPSSLPTWEKPNMLAKYHVTTEGVAVARRQGSSTG